MASAEKSDIEKTSLEKKLGQITGLDMISNVRGEVKIKRYDKRTFEQSISDIVDNSIDGGASKVNIYHRQTPGEDGKYALIVIDDGDGIKPEDMDSSISISTYKEEGYESWKLGAFGIGLKDASLAQCNELTLLSKVKGGSVELRRLSTLFVEIKDDWGILNRQHLEECGWITSSILFAEAQLNSMESGTAVIWEDLHALADKIIPDDMEETMVLIAAHESKVKDYISMTFSNYLEGIKLGPRSEKEPLSILFNGDELTPLDPFLKKEIGTEGGTLIKPYTFNLTFPSSGKSYLVLINRYILPKERGLRDPEHDPRMVNATTTSINDLQGIYYYRNGRLLDGPWNGQKWRTHGMGMADSHYTVAKWEVIFPPNISDEPNLLDPSKTGVITTENLVKGLKNAKDDKQVWLEPEDLSPYANSKPKNMYNSGVGVMYSKRAKARGDGHDVPVYCEGVGCGERVLNEGDKCESCTQYYCPSCRTIVTES